MSVLANHTPSRMITLHVIVTKDISSFEYTFLSEFKSGGIFSLAGIVVCQIDVEIGWEQYLQPTEKQVKMLI